METANYATYYMEWNSQRDIMELKAGRIYSIILAHYILVL
jgi:hypothetical protein